MFGTSVGIAMTPKTLKMDTPTLNQFEHVEFWTDNGILCCRSNKSDCYLTVTKINAYLSRIEKVTDSKPMPFLIDIRNFTGNFTPDAAKMFVDSPILKKNIITQAFVVDNLNGKLVTSSYKRIYGTEANIQIFTQLETAFAYCVETKNRYYAVEN